MSNKAVFLDRDGVICKEKSFISKKEDFELIPKSAEAIRILNENDYKTIVVTNQPVIARGICSIKEVEEIHDYMKELLKKAGARVDAIYLCPHHPSAGKDPQLTRECECRKPKPGLIIKAKEDFGINEMDQCYIIGDTIGDIKAGELAGCKTILVQTGHAGKEGFNDAVPMYEKENLYEAVKWIISQDRKNELDLFINTGGKGERLYPLTKDIPKPMIEVCGKPILHHLVDWAKSQGIKKIVMMNGYKQEKILDYFQDGSHLGISIVHSNEPYPLGSGGAIKFAQKHIDKRFVYISGDLVCDVDLKKMMEFHEKNNSQITALVHESAHPQDSDIIDIDENFRVKRFVSKNSSHEGAGNLGNAGLVIIEPEVLEMMEEEVFNFETYIYPKALEKNFRFFAYKSEEFLKDIGTFERLKKCEEFLKEKLGLNVL